MDDFEPKWKFVKPLGVGGQAHTYLVEERAEPKRLGAAKRLINNSREQRFQREIEAYRAISYPNVLRLLDHGVTPKDKPYLVSDYCENGHLVPEFFKGKTMLEVVAFFRSICDGVAAAHRKGIVHRDIKPANIVLNKANEPIVGDFGICFLVEKNIDETRLTETQEVVASRWFGAPEARNGREAVSSGFVLTQIKAKKDRWLGKK